MAPGPTGRDGVSTSADKTMNRAILLARTIASAFPDDPSLMPLPVPLP